MTAIPVFLASCSSLCFEVLLARFLSITQWSQMSFLVLSVALLGFGASGTVVSVGSRRDGAEARATAGLCVSTLLCFSVAAALPLDCYRIPFEPIQLLYLAAAFFLLAVPFFFAGLVAALGYVREPHRSGWIYLASMTGSGVGALLPLALIPLAGERGTLLVSALLPLASLPFGRKRLRSAALAAALAVAALSLALVLPRLGSYELSPYKKLSQLTRMSGTEVRDVVVSSSARIALASSPALRFAPALSLLYDAEVPRRQAVFSNGESQIVLPPPREAPEALASHYAAAYLLAPASPRVLVVESGGGLAPLAALSAGASAVEVVVADATVGSTLAGRYGAAGITVRRDSARAYLERTGALWDVIHVDDWGSSLPGMDSLSQAPLFTREACVAYLRHLTPEGALVFSRPLLLPPMEITRLVATLAEASEEMGAGEIGAHLAVLRSWDSYSLLWTRSPMTPGGETAIREFASRWRFDLVWLPGLEESEANRFNRWSEPYYYRAVRALLDAHRVGGEDRYLASLAYDAAPSTDDRPYLNRYTRVRGLAELLRGSASALPLLLSGEAIIVAVLAAALVASVAILALPAILAARARGGAAGSVGTLARFAALGLGFIAAESAFLQRLEVLFPHPVTCFSVTVSVVTVCSGLGSLARPRSVNLRALLLVLAALLLLAAVVMGPAVRLGMRLPPALTPLPALLLLAALSLPLGMPFSAAMERLDSGSIRGLGWAANGVAGVLGAVLAMQIALAAGIAALLLLAAMSYVAAAALEPRT